MISVILVAGMLAVATPAGLEAAGEPLLMPVIKQAAPPPVQVEFGSWDTHKAVCNGKCSRRIWVTDKWGHSGWVHPWQHEVGNRDWFNKCAM